MPELKTYDLFISHAWSHSDDYIRFVALINQAPNFRWRNYSAPRHDPAIDPNSSASTWALARALDDQIRPVNCVIVISGMYVTYRYWIQKEIDIALSFKKPIVGVTPWGQERIPQAVQEVAKEMVGWNTVSIVDAIRRWSI